MRAAASVALVAILASSAGAQPAPAPTAKQHYQDGEAALAAERYDDAVVAYTAAYELSKAPELLFKIAGAHHKANRCSEALPFYGRYMREGSPSETFLRLTRERIVECGGDPDQLAAPPPAPAPAPAPPPPPVVVETAKPAPVPAPKPLQLRQQGAWLLVGGSLAVFTVAGVLAYSANAAERDVEDLYVGLQGEPPEFDDCTRARYDELVDEGERYQLLARVSFGIGGALAAGAAYMFWRDRDCGEPARVAPVIGPRGGGVVVRF